MIEGFRMDLDTAYEFYKRCGERNANTEESRIAILQELQKELRVIKLNEQDLKNTLRGKNVLVVKKEENND